MNIENILKLADFLETLPHHNACAHDEDWEAGAAPGLSFNMSAWQQDHDCGTIACIAGSAWHLFPPHNHNVGIQSHAEKMLGIDEELGSDLFTPSCFPEGVHYENVTPKMAANQLRYVARTGEVSKDEWREPPAPEPEPEYITLTVDPASLKVGFMGASLKFSTPTHSIILWPYDLVEAAMCLWEAVIDAPARHEVFKKHKDYQGAAVLRMQMLEKYAKPCHDLWDAAEFDEPFDWEWCPAFLDIAIDPNTLEVRPDAAELMAEWMESR